MIMDPSSSLGLFAVVWLGLCIVSSALVTDAMLRTRENVPDPGQSLLTHDKTEQTISE